MGWERIPNTLHQYKVPGLFPYSDYDGWVIKDPEEMEFQSNWSWLMKVVEKINAIEKIEVSINKDYVDIGQYDEGLGFSQLACGEGEGSLLNNTYSAVIQFIEGRNK